MVVTLVGMEMDVRDVQRAKALPPIAVTPEGMETEVRVLPRLSISSTISSPL